MPDTPVARPKAGSADRMPGDAPILLRFFGGTDERVGVNGDYFTVGHAPDDRVQLPSTMGGASDIKIRFSRGAEGWRVTLAGEQSFYLNQSVCRGLTPLRSGDVIRLSPGCAGMQFLVRLQQDASLAKLVARHAPRLLRPRSSAIAPERQARKRLAPPNRTKQASVLVKRVLVAVLLIALAIALGCLIGSAR